MPRGGSRHPVFGPAPPGGFGAKSGTYGMARRVHWQPPTKTAMSPISALSKGEYAHSVELALIRHELSQPLTFLMTSLSLLKLRIERDLQSCEGAVSLVSALSA